MKLLTNYSESRDKSHLANRKEWEELLGPIKKVIDTDPKRLKGERRKEKK